MAGNPKNGWDQTRPVVNIFTRDMAATALADIVCLGLEEEGIPWDCSQGDDVNINAMAKQAADLSKLNVGLAIDGRDRMIVLHHRDLPKEKPLFTLAGEALEAENLRRLGANAARLVKGDPLVLARAPEEYPESDSISKPPEPTSRDVTAANLNQGTDQLTDQITELVVQVLKALQTDRG